MHFKRAAYARRKTQKRMMRSEIDTGTHTAQHVWSKIMNQRVSAFWRKRPRELFTWGKLTNKLKGGKTYSITCKLILWKWRPCLTLCSWKLYESHLCWYLSSTFPIYVLSHILSVLTLDSRSGLSGSPEEKCPLPNFWNLWMWLPWKKNLCKCN